MGAENRAVDPWDIPIDPELEDLLKALKRSLKLTIRTHMPAKVLAYNPATQTVTAEVGTLQVVKVKDPALIPSGLLVLKGTPPNAEAVLRPLILNEIPVDWPRTTSGYVTFPLQTGDTGTLSVHDRSLEQWLLLGQATDPVLAFTHSLKDSVFSPGLHSKLAPITPPTDLTGTVLDGMTLIKIGRLAVSAITKAEELTTVLDAAIAAAIAAAAPIASPAADGGTAGFTAWKSAWDGAKATIKAIKGRVE